LKKKTVAIILVPVVLLLATGALVAALAGCGGGSSTSSSGTPAAVVKQFMDANKNKDVNTLYKTLDKASQKVLSKADMQKAAAQSSTPATYTYKVGKTAINGNTASVDVTVSQGGTDSSATFALVKEGGAWKVDVGKTFGSSSGTTGTSSTP
jgi:limonene-1,2-epoxide hydrolase